MQRCTHVFIRQYLGAVALALLPVLLTAFLAIPYHLGAHPGEARAADPAGGWHAT